MKFSRDSLLGLGLIVVLLIVAVFAAVAQPREERLPALSTRSNDPDGARALALWLRALEYAVDTSVSASFGVPSESEGGLIMMLEPSEPVSRADLRKLESTLEDTGGTLLIAAGGEGECRQAVRLNDEPVPDTCDESLVFVHHAVFSDREVVVGLRKCGQESAACRWRRPFWLELRKGVPATLREQAGVWAGSADIAVQATDDAVLVDLGTWNGERRATALTAAGNLVVTRAQLPPKPLGRADCAMVARSLEDCVASRQCGSFADAARRIPAAQWASLQRLYHETTGLDVEAYRKLCVRSCELGLLPSRGLVRQYACDGAPTGQWPADNPAGGLER